DHRHPIGGVQHRVIQDLSEFDVMLSFADAMHAGNAHVTFSATVYRFGNSRHGAIQVNGADAYPQHIDSAHGRRACVSDEHWHRTWAKFLRLAIRRQLFSRFACTDGKRQPGSAWRPSHAFQNFVKRASDLPTRKVGFQFCQVADIADVISCARFIDVFVSYLSVQQSLNLIHTLQNGSAVFTASAEVVNFTGPRLDCE